MMGLLVGYSILLNSRGFQSIGFEVAVRVEGLRGTGPGFKG